MKASHLALEFWVALTAAAGTLPTITVRLYDYAGVPADVTEQAEKEAQRVLDRAGVGIRFIGYVLRDGYIERRNPTVTAPITSVDLLITITGQDRLGLAGDGQSLGHALIVEGRPAIRAFVIYERVRRHARKHTGSTEFRLLGHVIAHEIAHLLLGDVQHSLRGMMAGLWRKREMLQIEQGMMVFSPDQVHRLKAGAIARLQASPRD